MLVVVPEILQQRLLRLEIQLLHETPILDLHPQCTQYVESKLLHNFKGQTNIYLVKVAPNVNTIKQDYLSIMYQVFLQGL